MKKIGLALAGAVMVSGIALVAAPTDAFAGNSLKAGNSLSNTLKAPQGGNSLKGNSL